METNQETLRRKASRDLLRLIKYYNECTEEEREDLLLYISVKKMEHDGAQVRDRKSAYND